MKTVTTRYEKESILAFPGVSLNSAGRILFYGSRASRHQISLVEKRGTSSAYRLQKSRSVRSESVLVIKRASRFAQINSPRGSTFLYMGQSPIRNLYLRQAKARVNLGQLHAFGYKEDSFGFPIVV